MQKLFTEFKHNSAEEWKAQVMKELKGETFDSLVWHNENGFDIQPFYTHENVKLPYEPAFTHADWNICTKAKSNDSQQLNTQLLKELNAGASAISFSAENSEPEVALRNIELNYIHSTLFIDCTSERSLKNAHKFKSYLKKNYDLADLHCSLFPEKLETEAQLKNWLAFCADFTACPLIKTCCFDALYYHNQNCHAYYEVAIILSGLNEYLNQVSENKSKPLAPFVVKTGVNSDYFIQIAKLRAIRRLWNVLKIEYQVNNDLYVVVETGLTNKSVSDSYNNLLRTTVEAMAAVSGGCNELIVNEFDTLFTVNKSLSQRMAINQQLILKDESYLNKMADIACGSYYIESITDLIANKALDSFKFFEAGGGYFKCLEKNIFSNEIAVQAKRKSDNVYLARQTVIGVNKYRNEKEIIELTPAQRELLDNLPVNNPILSYELDHYLK